MVEAKSSNKIILTPTKTELDKQDGSWHEILYPPSDTELFLNTLEAILISEDNLEAAVLFLFDQGIDESNLKESTPYMTQTLLSLMGTMKVITPHFQQKQRGKVFLIPLAQLPTQALQEEKLKGFMQAFEAFSNIWKESLYSFYVDYQVIWSDPKLLSKDSQGHFKSIYKELLMPVSQEDMKQKWMAETTIRQQVNYIKR